MPLARGVSHSSTRASASASIRLPMPRGPLISSACGQFATRDEIGEWCALPAERRD
jgi:hypothetical protein